MRKESNQPKLLAIETSGELCGIAVVSETMTYLSQFSGKYLHDQYLAELVNRALSDLHLQPEDLDAVVLSAGPGSFTGLRIGSSFVKGFCFSVPPYFIAVPTPEAIALSTQELLQYFPNARIVVLIPSHRQMLYAQEFATDYSHTSDLLLLPEGEILNRYNNSNWIVAGPGALICPDAISLSPYKQLNPLFIAKLGMKYYEAKKFTDPATFSPLYGQEFQPKVQTKKRNSS